MEERAVKDFMIIRPSNNQAMRLQALKFLLIFFLMSSCKPDRSDDPIPYVRFPDIILNLTLPAYQALSSDGGYAYVDGGVKGIILYRKSSTTYFAFERNCTFQPNEAGSTVDAQPFDMHDSFCGSSFSYANGHPTSGSAWRPLQQYEVLFAGGSTLTITDTVVE